LDPPSLLLWSSIDAVRIRLGFIFVLQADTLESIKASAMSRSVSFTVAAVLVLFLSTMASSFVVVPTTSSSGQQHPFASSSPPVKASVTQLGMIFNNKNKKNGDFDLSDIETRDMTPAEMRALNAKNEEIMNAELLGMTIFSLILSVPMLYLVWVGFFSETANTVDDVLPY
jgi:hypothetical protein